MEEFKVKDQILKKEFHEEFIDNRMSELAYDYKHREGSCYCNATSMPPCSWCENGIEHCYEDIEELYNDFPDMFEHIIIYMVRQSINK